MDSGNMKEIDLEELLARGLPLWAALLLWHQLMTERAKKPTLQ